MAVTPAEIASSRARLSGNDRIEDDDDSDIDGPCVHGSTRVANEAKLALMVRRCGHFDLFTGVPLSPGVKAEFRNVESHTHRKQT